MVSSSGDEQLIDEAIDVLRRHLGPARAARFLAAWHAERESYMDARDKTFGSSTVDELFTQLREFEAERRA